MSADHTAARGSRKQAIRTSDAPPPGGSYSQGVKAGNLVFLSGQTPRDEERRVVDGSFEDQARQVFENLSAVARAANTTLADAVRVTVYLREWDNFSVMDAVYASYFPEPRPARTTIQSNLPVEIEVDAILVVQDEPSS
jgi:2-iminobutanoate/2-iminopropanoate deaminase